MLHTTASPARKPKSVTGVGFRLSLAGRECYGEGMQHKLRHRLATDHPLRTGALVLLEGNPAHYLTQVLRMKEGDALALFNREDGEWLASIAEVKKRAVVLHVNEQKRTPQAQPDFWVCFAPIKGGRLETIIEKATELGAALLQPALTQRTIVDKVNRDRAVSIAREAAEQCERIEWPEVAEPKKLANLLGDWPKDRLLVYGDETGAGVPIQQLLAGHGTQCNAEAARLEAAGERGGLDGFVPPSAHRAPQKWAILAGPEGGFTPEEIALLHHCKFARGVSLGPRILRADTAVITLAALTLAAWGDWHQAPRFEGAAP